MGALPPRLRINKFETESQKDEQKGFEQILRGLFQGIRNPRTHAKIEDTRESADAIIVFINHVLRVIQQSKRPFVLDEWIDRVFDVDFVADERYARLLAAEVPAKRRSQALIRIYEKKTMGAGENLGFILEALTALSEVDQLDEFIGVVSEDLRITNDEKEIHAALRILPPQLWPRIDEVARLRIENKLLLLADLPSFAQDTLFTDDNKPLGAWAAKFAQYFTLKKELYWRLLRNIETNDESQNYVATFFWEDLLRSFQTGTNPYPMSDWVNAICFAIAHYYCGKLLEQCLWEDYWNLPDEWRTAIVEKLKELENNSSKYYVGWKPPTRTEHTN